jgi:hypothetical protein
MGLEILALFLILLAKAQKGAGSLFGPPTPATAASDASAKAAQAAADAQAAAKAGDHATAQAKAAEANQHAATAAQAAKAASTPPPWPQVIPSDLPPFPGGGWKPANPVTSAMASRAWQLLAQLWEHGEGTWKAEKTGDRWVVYKAAHTSPDKKGVIAYTTSQPSASADSSPSAMAPQAPPQPGQQSQIVPASHTQAPSSATGLPTLRPPPAAPARGPAVIALQQRLGVPQTGTYDGSTIAAVHAFQLAHPATGDHNGRPDNIVGDKMWKALGFGAGQAAA